MPPQQYVADGSGEVLLGVEHVFYRIVQREIPTADDFRTMKELGFPLENEGHFREWAENISVYNSQGYAIRRARATKLPSRAIRRPRMHSRR